MRVFLPENDFKNLQQRRMQLKRFTDLGLRILMYLGQGRAKSATDEANLVTVTELANKLQWNKNLVVKVTHFMVQEGWLAAVRGRNGGLLLAKDASEYRIGDIVQKLEGDERLLDCSEPPCPLCAGCGLIGALHAAHMAFYAKLNENTLADILKNPTLQEAIVKLYRHRTDS